jgi:hypothetical protein
MNSLQNLRVTDESSRDGDSLFLASGEHDPFLADDCVKSGWKRDL